MGSDTSGKCIDELAYQKIKALLEGGKPLDIKEIQNKTGLHYRTAYRYIRRIESREKCTIAKTITGDKYFIVNH